MKYSEPEGSIKEVNMAQKRSPESGARITASAGMNEGGMELGCVPTLGVGTMEYRVKAQIHSEKNKT
ncbi:MAG TPA: hypothetical protein DCZ75_00965 [Geobacter sp.]|nr:hypothetical protein [Geobacter sp.]